MENTITLALSLNAIKQEINAQCAWVDATNLATLPPIVNPVDNADTEKAIMASLSLIYNRLSGYIATIRQDGDIIDVEMYIARMNATRQSSLAQTFNDFAVYHSLSELYAPQAQAKHITALFREKSTHLLSSAKQLLATMQ